MSLQINDRALDRVCKLVGVERDVWIQFESDPVHPIGVCYPSDTDSEPHLIYVNPELDKLDANYVVCHELKHAAQEEADLRFSSGQYRRELEAVGIDPEQFMANRPLELPENLHAAYTNIPSEREADEFARANCDLYEVLVER